ncbi:hypothetical protein [Longimicrobium terrae]|uniref:IraD/Gp25-like domain-containing protein n=1 Tax=Longimicrobium terrae TaxID=1639882 RepID=A0A841H2E7_9BACT|nr:hypothetical protein [Longimicrobium terrae]MBB4637820.1 hypothetical protein [Longimicrobium terrae]MBB6072325.1 hypothetical protein [Longimicrobium terrae]NNC31244.1 hypothetical protein [Longimicrobium terrae]
MVQPTLLLPLRVEPDGQLARGDAVDSLVQLFKVMAATPAGSWGHARWFGLQEVFAAANPLLHDQQALADALNAALRGLEVRWARVHSVTTAPDRAQGERHFRITLMIEGGRVEHTRIAV